MDKETATDTILRYRRIIVVGSSGSGKSYLSKRLARITELPLIHLDKEFWRPDWQKTPREEWIQKQRTWIASEEWILDGNYDSTMEMRFSAADLVIYLDVHRIICIVSALLRHGKKRSDLPAYLEEKIDGDFWDFCRWIWSFPQKGGRTILALHERYAQIPFLHIRGRREMKRLLAQWERA